MVFVVSLFVWERRLFAVYFFGSFCFSIYFSFGLRRQCIGIRIYGRYVSLESDLFCIQSFKFFVRLQQFRYAVIYICVIILNIYTFVLRCLLGFGDFRQLFRFLFRCTVLGLRVQALFLRGYVGSEEVALYEGQRQYYSLVFRRQGQGIYVCLGLGCLFDGYLLFGFYQKKLEVWVFFFIYFTRGKVQIEMLG